MAYILAGGRGSRLMELDGLLCIMAGLPSPTSRADEAAAELGASYFAYRAAGTERDLKELFRIARRSLATGVSTLAFCVGVGRVAVNIWPASPLTSLLEQSSLGVRLPVLLLAAFFNTALLFW
jgi:Kef-type K+ transport system membrane component KefB